VNVSQPVVVIITHADVVNRVVLFSRNGFKLLQNNAVFAGLTEFIHECNFHM
jgi:hypothetical protein